ncbi:sugar porter family MFS transporter [Streptomyces sp. TRM49041]|uniref:sugar porter family MFS transporter n=1 Tax=Streptomyces sp. TRM49041 TaxID=2603216 RepID=UPI0011EF0E4B|nr:sugar porter family MFS transporter [Streptomyces sp. TRM49041]
MQLATDTSRQSATTRAGSSVAVVAMIAAMSGLLFGYDTGIIATALPGISESYNLTSEGDKQIITSALLLGAVFSAPFTSYLCDRYGRKPMLLLIAVLFIAATAVCAIRTTPAILTVARFFLGLAIGAASGAAPIYISEMSPAERRGRLVVLFQLMIMIGIVCAHFTGYFIGHQAWQWLIGFGVLPALVMLLGVTLLPESPRWLYAHGMIEKAQAVLLKLRGDRELVERELGGMAEAVAEEQQANAGSWKEFFSARVRPALVLGGGVAMFSQITGNNALVYYMPTVFHDLGFSENASVLMPAFGAVGVLVMTFIGSYLVDIIGRRKYLLVMVPISILSFIVIALLLGEGSDATQGWQLYAVFAAVILYMVANNGAFGVTIWLINSEVYPTKLRGKGGAFGAFSHWFFDFLIAATTLTMFQYLGAAGPFWLFTAISVLSLAFVYFLLPETKGKSLEKIEHELHQGRFYQFQRRG